MQGLLKSDAVLYEYVLLIRLYKEANVNFLTRTSRTTSTCCSLCVAIVLVIFFQASTRPLGRRTLSLFFSLSLSLSLLYSTSSHVNCRHKPVEPREHRCRRGLRRRSAVARHRCEFPNRPRVMHLVHQLRAVAARGGVRKIHSSCYRSSRHERTYAARPALLRHRRRCCCCCDAGIVRQPLHRAAACPTVCTALRVRVAVARRVH